MGTLSSLLHKEIRKVVGNFYRISKKKYIKMQGFNRSRPLALSMSLYIMPINMRSSKRYQIGFIRLRYI